MICPKCKKEQPDSTTCIFCQVVVEKYLKLHPSLDKPLNCDPAPAPPKDDATPNDPGPIQKTNDIVAKYSLIKQSIAEAEQAALESKRTFRRRIIVITTISIIITYALYIFVFRTAPTNTRETATITPDESARLKALESRVHVLENENSQLKASVGSRVSTGPRSGGAFRERDTKNGVTLSVPLQASGASVSSGMLSHRSEVIAPKPSEHDPNETHVRIKVVTDIHGGTTDNPIIELFDNTGDFFNGRTVASLVLNKPGYDQLTDTNIYDFTVPHPFCAMVGWRLKKPAESSIDSPWKLKEIYIYLDDELVYMDRVFDRYHPPVTANCNQYRGNWCAAGGWQGTTQSTNCSQKGLEDFRLKRE